MSISKGESRPQAGKFWHFEGPKTPIPKGKSPRKWFRNGPDLIPTDRYRKPPYVSPDFGPKGEVLYGYVLIAR